MLESAERRSEEGRRRLEEVEREWEDDLERRADAEKRTEREKEMWMAQRVELEGKVSELRETVERLVEASGGGDDGELTQVSFGAAFGGGGDEGGMSLMSPTASLASSLMRKKGQSVTDLYVENVRVKNELVKQEAEVRRLEGCLQEVLRDIQERVSVLPCLCTYTRFIDGFTRSCRPPFSKNNAKNTIVWSRPPTSLPTSSLLSLPSAIFNLKPSSIFHPKPSKRLLLSPNSNPTSPIFPYKSSLSLEKSPSEMIPLCSTGRNFLLSLKNLKVTTWRASSLGT